MATGFMPRIIALLAFLAAGAAAAAEVALIGVIGDKAAVLAVDGGDPKTVKVGQRWNGIAVLSVQKDRATVEIDGNPVRFLVDTGATSIALPARDANRLGIDYRKGLRGMTQTANGVVAVYRVSLDRVRLGGIELNSVDAVVIEQGLEIALLGMSFLNRVEMKREGQTMTLIRRF